MIFYCKMNIDDIILLQITELIFGSICVIFGAAICGIAGYGISYSTKQYIYNPHTGDYEYIYVPRILRISVWGEGIWCGVWVNMRWLK